MTEPKAVAPKLETVVPGVLHWRLSDERIGGATSSAHAVRDRLGATVLVDPLPLGEEALAELEPVRAIVLTAATHQRSSWRYRKRFGAPVYLPAGSRATEEAPDEHYGAGDTLPGGLEAVHAPGPEDPHYALLLREGPGVLFCPDLVMMDRQGPLVFVPARFHDDPAETRRSVERLLGLPFAVLCLDHGPPVLEDPKGALRRLLSETESG